MTLWYGERDTITPPSIGRDFERDLPNATLRLVDDGHQLLFSRWTDILRELATHELAARATRMFS